MVSSVFLIRPGLTESTPFIHPFIIFHLYFISISCILHVSIHHVETAQSWQKCAFIALVVPIYMWNLSNSLLYPRLVASQENIWWYLLKASHCMCADYWVAIFTLIAMRVTLDFLNVDCWSSCFFLLGARPRKNNFPSFLWQPFSPHISAIAFSAVQNCSMGDLVTHW